MESWIEINVTDNSLLKLVTSKRDTIRVITTRQDT